jgi:hypothetical protein
VARRHPQLASAVLIGANVAGLALGRRKLRVPVDESVSLEERQLMERLDPSYRVEHALDRGLSGTVTTPPSIEPSGIRCEIRLDGTWTVKALTDKADSIRALLGAGASGTGKSWSFRPLMATAHLRGDLLLIDGKGEEATLWESACRVAVERDVDLAFTRPDGRPIDPRDGWEEFKELLAEAGIGDPRLYDGSRHTAGTILNELGVDMPTMMEILRHTQISQTRRCVKGRSHLSKDAVRRMGDAFLPAPESAPEPATETRTETGDRRAARSRARRRVR